MNINPFEDVSKLKIKIEQEKLQQYVTSTLLQSQVKDEETKRKLREMVKVKGDTVLGGESIQDLVKQHKQVGGGGGASKWADEILDRAEQNAKVSGASGFQALAETAGTWVFFSAVGAIAEYIRTPTPSTTPVVKSAETDKCNGMMEKVKQNLNLDDGQVVTLFGTLNTTLGDIRGLGAISEKIVTDNNLAQILKTNNLTTVDLLNLHFTKWEKLKKNVESLYDDINKVDHLSSENMLIFLTNSYKGMAELFSTMGTVQANGVFHQ